MCFSLLGSANATQVPFRQDRDTLAHGHSRGNTTIVAVRNVLVQKKPLATRPLRRAWMPAGALTPL
jgi:hypothetical protein